MSLLLEKNDFEYLEKLHILGLDFKQTSIIEILEAKKKKEVKKLLSKKEKITQYLNG